MMALDSNKLLQIYIILKMMMNYMAGDLVCMEKQVLESLSS